MESIVSLSFMGMSVSWVNGKAERSAAFVFVFTFALWIKLFGGKPKTSVVDQLLMLNVEGKQSIRM